MSEIDRDGCGCCEGIVAQTPAEIYNPPGLPAITYRVGTYAQFKYSMQTHLADADLPGLRSLRTRADDDFSIALLDSWAVVADVLTFYQERIANESYRRTATERASLLELAHLVNYRLQPGVAANTYLAFSMETAIGSPAQTTIGIGTKIQSLPDPGEKPQVFETIEEIEARSTWNVFKPGLTKEQPISPDMPEVILQGANTNLKRGDVLLIIVADSGDKSGFAKAIRRVKSVAIDSPVKGQTTVQLEAPASSQEQAMSAAASGAQGQPPAVPGGAGGPGQEPAAQAKEGFLDKIGQAGQAINQDIDKVVQAIGQEFKKADQAIGQDIDKLGGEIKELIEDLDPASAITQPITAAAGQTQANAMSGSMPQASALPAPLAAFRQIRPLNDTAAEKMISVPGLSQSKLEDIAVVQGWSIQDVYANIAAQPPQPPQGTNITGQTTLPLGQHLPVPGVYALRVRSAFFGYNAPDWKAMHDSIQAHYPHPGGSDWTLDPQQNQTDQLMLARVYTQITPGSWLVIEQPAKDPVAVQVISMTETAAANYALSGQVTQLGISPAFTPVASFSEHRQVTVYGQSEWLTPAGVPDTTPIKGASIEIPGLTDGPGDGRTVMVVGQIVGSSGGPQAEIAILGDSIVDPVKTTLKFRKELANIYKRETLSVFGNIARATQGETIQDEVLGSGDASQSYQHFTLRQSPLTFIQAPTQTGKASTLSISVDAIPWKEVDTFYGHGPREPIYVTHIENDGTVTVEFGDGITGARLPTGEDNIHATYRKGTGIQGVVQPGQLSVLRTRPLGVKSVTNPVSPTGADDPETIDDARRNASNTIFTLGRIVSGEDYEEFALSYARVAKAQATTIWTNRVRSVYVTIAGPPTSDTLDDAKIAKESALYGKILSGMRSASDPTVPFALETFSLVLFTLAVKVKVDPNSAPDQVLRAVELAVRSHFSFDARRFGQEVTLDEVNVVIQAVPGVVLAHIDSFYDSLKLPSRESRIDAVLPHIQADGSVSLAELLIVSPGHPFDSLEVML
jgi:predicted phage baseplate assembly protein